MKKSIFAIAALSLAVPVSAADFGHVANSTSLTQVTQASEYRRSDYKQGYRQGRRDQRLGANARVWRDRDGRYRCQRNDGTTGLLIGAAAGGVAGNVIAGRGDKTLGTILGAAGGALLGREIDRDKVRCR
jgi:uncharacterized protein YcfJ